MKLSLLVDSDDDISDSLLTEINYEGIAKILESELEKFYPDSKRFENVEISLSFVKPEEIQELNKTYRNIDEATDVLSFPMIEFDSLDEIEILPMLSLGDIIICPDEVKRLHSELKFNEAIYLMIAHSFLHLLGFDHDTAEKQNEMWELQDGIKCRILASLESN